VYEDEYEAIEAQRDVEYEEGEAADALDAEYAERVEAAEREEAGRLEREAEYQRGLERKEAERRNGNGIKREERRVRPCFAFQRGQCSDPNCKFDHVKRETKIPMGGFFRKDKEHVLVLRGEGGRFLAYAKFYGPIIRMYRILKPEDGATIPNCDLMAEATLDRVPGKVVLMGREYMFGRSGFQSLGLGDDSLSVVWRSGRQQQGVLTE